MPPIKKTEFKVTNFEYCGDLAVSIGLTVSMEVGVGLGKAILGIGLGGTATIAFTAGARIGIGANWHTGMQYSRL